MTWTAKLWKFNTTPDDVDMTAMQADITAQADGDTGAPKNKSASMDTNSVDSTQIVAAAVSQGLLPTATSEVSGSPSLATRGETVVLAGGEYGFYPQSRHGSGTYDTRIKIGAGEWDSEASAYIDGISNLSYQTNIGFKRISGTPGVQYAKQRYISASPPYDLGNGLCHLFIFCLLDSSGNIKSTYIAPDAPWHNSGPTNIARYRVRRLIKTEQYDYTDLRHMVQLIKVRMNVEPGSITKRDLLTMQEWINTIGALDLAVDYSEVSQGTKQADMHMIPHPFINMKSGDQVVLLDPVSDLSGQLNSIQQEDGESIAPLLHDGFFKISNNALARVGPPGVKTVSYRWK